MVDQATQAEYDRRSFEARLSSLQRTVTELVSGEGIGSVLPRIIHAAGRAVQARAYVLSIDHPIAQELPLYWHGTDGATARQYMTELNEDRGIHGPHVLVAEINAAGARYGRLIAFRRPGEAFNASERSLLETYASLAAAALNSATVLDDARREAATNRSLFELSSSLVEIGTVSDIAQRLADAVPSVIGCDRSIVTIREHPETSGSCVAVSGYDPAAEVIALGAVKERAGRLRERGALIWHDPSDPSSSAAELAGATRSALAVTFPMYVGDEFIGSITADVLDWPERLRNLPDLSERLQGLAGYAAVGLRNAQLLEELRHQSLHDALTGLPNRRLILDRIEQMLARGRRNEIKTGLFFIDLDSFKDVNDTFGHDAGDELLKAVSARFLEAIRETDTVGRLGGDEFVVLVEGVSLAAGPELVAQRLIDVLDEPFWICVQERSHEVRISTSIGVVLGPCDGSAKLLRDGDIALYEAKAAGKRRFVVYEPGMVHAGLRDHH
jgi:diguanylate cyclase (GGDEF)-like protein